MNQQPPAAGLASLLASQGRGPDKTLVHMSPEEVRNLQTLAQSQGIQMPVNPVTGLPEAGWLTNILNTVVKGVQSVGRNLIQNPQTTALLAGAAYGAVKGDLRKGLEAGMKAYGGTRILGGLAEEAQRSIPGVAGPTGYKERPPGPEDFGDIAPGIGVEPVQPTVQQPLGKDVSSGLRNLLGSALGGKQTGATQQGQPTGLFGLSKDPIMQAITMYALNKAEQKMNPRGGVPKPPPVEYRNVQYSPGRVNPRFGEPGQPYFIEGGYSDYGYSTEYPGYTQNPQQGIRQVQPYRPPPLQRPPDEGEDYYRRGMAGGGVVPQPNLSYPMIRARGNGYEPQVGVYTGEETFAEGGTADSDKEEYFKSLLPFAPALTECIAPLPNLAAPLLRALLTQIAIRLRDFLSLLRQE